MEIRLVEKNEEQFKELEEIVKENPRMNEATFREIAKTVNLSFSVENCSRLLSHHICETHDSYTQQSQRYVKMGPEAFVVPEEIKKAGDGMEKEYCALNAELFEFYSRMTKMKEGFAGRRATEADYVHGIKIEDGRYVLPLSTTTNVFTTMSFSRIVNFYRTMKRLHVRESEELLKKLGDALKSEAIPKKVEEMSVSGRVDDSEVKEFCGEDCARITPKDNAVLLNHFSDPVMRSGLGALTSTGDKPPNKKHEGRAKENKVAEKTKGVTERVMGYGHTSIIEHARATCGLMMTLTCYHQFERHRLPSNIRERFVDIPLDREVLVPESVKRSAAMAKEFSEKVKKVKEFRKKLADSETNGAEQYLLLNCDLLKVISSTNARMDKEIMGERLCNNAQWEIRNLYDKKLSLIKKTAPSIYGKIGPSCTRGPCPEGALTCGKTPEMRAKYGYYGK